MKILRTMPTESIMCVALIKSGSELDRRTKSTTPAYCIYEYDRGFGTREIRFGDGSWLSVDERDHEDLLILPELSEDILNELLN